MALFFSGTQDQALLAMMVQEAQNAKALHILGRTTVQKVMYFLTSLGVPSEYKFTVHHYGPFCEQILRDTELLIADDVIRDSSANPSTSAYVPGTNVDELVSKYASTLEPHRQAVRNVVSALVPLRPRNLELLATLHYCYRFEKSTSGHGPWKNKVIRRFREFKGDRFKLETISKGFDSLVKARLVEP
jgi:uncharacterized protein